MHIMTNTHRPAEGALLPLRPDGLATSTTATTRDPQRTNPFANELHPQWCQLLDDADQAPGCGAHGSIPEHILLLSNGAEYTCQGAVFPRLEVCGVIHTDRPTPALTVEVGIYAPRLVGFDSAVLYFTTAEAVELAVLLDTGRAGSVAATGESPFHEVRLYEIEGALSLAGVADVVLDRAECAALAGALRQCVALPSDPGTFVTWAHKRPTPAS